jgi:hypothetical protein
VSSRCVTDYFSPDYVTARSRFCEAVNKLGARLDSLRLAARGPGGEPLTIDIGWFGSEHPSRVLIHSSGIHGVEGFAGSAIQLQFVADLPTIAPDTAVVLVHILNPYGMAWLRRCNESNVDLNRNFLSESEAYDGMPEGYARFDTFLNPSSPPHHDLFFLKAAWLIARHGMPRLKEAVLTGQYEHPRGLFFGGKEIQEEARLYRDYVTQRLADARRVIAVDVHTGLGKSGHDTLLVDPSQCERLRRIFGDHVVPMQAERSVGYRVRGGVQEMLSRASNGRLDFVGQEFGTRGPLQVLRALRDENHWHHYGTGDIDHPSKRALRNAFCPPMKSWREAVLKHGEEVLDRARDFLDSKD